MSARNLSPILLLAVLLIACSEQIVKQDIETEFSFVMPAIIDTTKTEQVKRSGTWLDAGDYSPLYIGKKQDSIFIQKKFYAIVNKMFDNYSVYDEAREKYKRPDSTGIQLIIDTSKIILNQSYAVAVVNTTRDTLNIGYGTHLPIILEALDKQGAWKPVEEPFVYFCGTGLGTLFLPPGEIVITSAPVFTGEYNTKLRLRYDRIVSQTYTGSINLSQFESRWDENGNDKESR
jgi:hypothetical protein